MLPVIEVIAPMYFQESGIAVNRYDVVGFMLLLIGDLQDIPGVCCSRRIREACVVINDLVE